MTHFVLWITDPVYADIYRPLQRICEDRTVVWGYTGCQMLAK